MSCRRPASAPPPTVSFHLDRALLSCAPTKPRWNKRDKFPERRAAPFVSILPPLFFKKTRSHLPADKSPLLLVLPPRQPQEADVSIYKPSLPRLLSPYSAPDCTAEACVHLFEECRSQWQISSPALSLQLFQTGETKLLLRRPTALFYCCFAFISALQLP